ncbi:MAG: hypothetical protein EZS28_027481 [Streblomastix strix]|uniref:Syndetin C-terminal domain-containing protein n=1 Tax=Streblomastix strix TaxID=222440 RepID=A0A5J4V3L1_9EUKA|nr:MAG: hypothetical protein EZS28_027481 [Streblomastix strix]
MKQEQNINKQDKQSSEVKAALSVLQTTRGQPGAVEAVKQISQLSKTDSKESLSSVLQQQINQTQQSDKHQQQKQQPTPPPIRANIAYTNIPPLVIQRSSSQTKLNQNTSNFSQQTIPGAPYYLTPQIRIPSASIFPPFFFFFPFPLAKSLARDYLHLIRPVSFPSLHSPTTICQRIIGAESLITLAVHLDQLKHLFIHYLSENDARMLLAGLFDQIVTQAQQIRSIIYRNIAASFIDLSRIPSEIEKIQWDIKDVVIDCNSYVSVLAFEFRQFKERLEQEMDEGLLWMNLKEINQFIFIVHYLAINQMI